MAWVKRGGGLVHSRCTTVDHRGEGVKPPVDLMVGDEILTRLGEGSYGGPAPLRRVGIRLATACIIVERETAPHPLVTANVLK